MKLHWHAGSDPHNQGQVYDEATGETVAITYNDEGGRMARAFAAQPDLLAVAVTLENLIRNGAFIGSDDLRTLQAAIAKARGE